MNRLKELRKKKGLTQQELANEIGVTKLSVSNWENGKHEIKSDKAQILANYFSVPVTYLIGYDKDTMAKTLALVAEELRNVSINDYEKLEEISSAYTNIEKYIGNPKKYEQFGKSLAPFNVNYILILQRLIIADKEVGANYADVLINYLTLDEYDKKVIFDFIKKLADKDTQ